MILPNLPPQLANQLDVYSKLTRQAEYDWIQYNLNIANPLLVSGGPLGTPSSGDATNLTGTAAGLTAGHVTTNANLTGIVTSVGNATAIADGAIATTKIGDTAGRVPYFDTTGFMGTDAALTFNDVTGALTTTTFIGALTGNATTAGSATFATTAGSATFAATAGSSTTSVTATNLAGGSGGTVPYQSVSGTTAMLANGTAGQVLTANGTTVAPSWGTTVNGTAIPATATLVTTTTINNGTLPASHTTIGASGAVTLTAGPGALTLTNTAGANAGTNIVIQGTNGASASTVYYAGINVFSTNGTFDLRSGGGLGLSITPGGVVSVTTGLVVAGVKATSAAAPTIASATTIAPTTQIVFVSGTTAVATITPPSPISLGGGQITIIPTGVFATTTAGNIALVSTAVVNKALIMTYDVTTTKWYPSY